MASQTLKRCCKCKEALPLSMFGKDKGQRDGLKRTCKKCIAIGKKKYNTEHHDEILIKNKGYRDSHKEEAHEYYEENKDKIAAQHLARRSEIKEYMDNYHATHKPEARNNRAKNKEKLTKRIKDKLENDEGFRLITNYRRRVLHALNGERKNATTKELVGCSLNDWWSWLERGFSPEMTRKNTGKIWHVDHIIPVDFYDMKDRQQIKEAFHYSNTQPLLIRDNLSKGNKMPWNWPHPKYALKNPALLKVLDSHKTESCCGK